MEKKDLEKLAKATISIIAGASLYLSGFMAYTIKNDAFHYPEEYIQLNKKEAKLNTKISEWQRFIPLMKEPFASQYRDSLQNGIKEANEMRIKLIEIKSEHDKMADKTIYSWGAFFIK